MITSARSRLTEFFFSADRGLWLTILRIGLGLQVTLYAWSLRYDWSFLFHSDATGPVIRTFNEAVLTYERTLTPRMSWLIDLGHIIGQNETFMLNLVWFSLLLAGCLLLVGILSRPASILAWFLYLSTIKSGGLFSYGVDHFTTIGLFYLTISPLPGGWGLGIFSRREKPQDPAGLGFHRRILQLHLCIIYLFGGVSKCLGIDWWNGTSIWRALIRPPFDVVPADVLAHFAWVLPPIGIAVCLLETGYSFFIWRKSTRALWLAGILLMHLSIGLTMGLYLFALIMIVLNLAAFGPEYLISVTDRIRSLQKRDRLSADAGGSELAGA